MVGSGLQCRDDLVQRVSALEFPRALVTSPRQGLGFFFALLLSPLGIEAVQDPEVGAKPREKLGAFVGEAGEPTSAAEGPPRAPGAEGRGGERAPEGSMERAEGRENDEAPRRRVNTQPLGQLLKDSARFATIVTPWVFVVLGILGRSTSQSDGVWSGNWRSRGWQPPSSAYGSTS